MPTSSSAPSSTPTLKGKVKITVIATGFGPQAAARSAATGSGAYTPVDMTHYADSRPPARRTGAAAAAAAERPGSAETVGRPPAGLRCAAGSSAAPQHLSRATGADSDFGLGSAFDVPAFLRRQEG